MNIRAKFILPFVLLCGTFSAVAQTSAPSYDELLNLSLEELMKLDVVTTSKISTANLAEVPSVVSVLTEEDIRNSGARTMEEVLRMVAGFDVVRSGFTSTASIGVRGLYSTDGTNNKILFLIDGHPFRSATYGDATAFLGNYPVNDIASLEIVRGPGSTLFGAGAFLAVINIKTKEAAKRGAVSAAVGSYNTQEVYGTTNFKIQDLKLKLSGNYFKTDGPKIELKRDFASEVFEPFTAAMGMEGPVGAAPGTLNYGRATANLQLNAAYKNLYLIGSHMQSADQPVIGPLEALGKGNSIKNTATFAELGLKLPLKDDKGEFLIKTYYDGFQTNSELEWWSAETTQIFNEFTRFYHEFDPQYTKEPTFYQQNEAFKYHTQVYNSTLGSEMNFAYNHKNKVKLISGLMYEHSAQSNIQTHANGNIFFMSPLVLDNETFAPSEALGGMKDISGAYNWNKDASRNVVAAFGQAEVNFTNLLHLKESIHYLSVVAGARYDNYSDAGGDFNPRAALLFSPVEKLYFKALYGEAFRAPSFVELYSQHNPILMGNAELKPEHVQTIEAVVGYKPFKGSEISLAYFNTQVSDNIQLMNTDLSQMVSVYTNVGDYRTSGLETDFRFTLKQAAYVYGTLTYQNVLDVTNAAVLAINNEEEQVQFTQENFDPGKAPKLMASLGANYPVHRNISVNVSGNYIGERNRTEASQWELDPATWRTTGNIVALDTRAAIPAALLLNAAVTVHDFSFARGFELQLSAFNLTNSTYYNPNTILRSTDLQRGGRNVLAKLRYNF